MRPKFCLQRSESMSREQLAVINSARKLDVTYRIGNVCEPDEIPIGDLPFCERVFGTQPRIKQMYPEFLKHWLHRSVVLRQQDGRLFHSCIRRFAKNASDWKGAYCARIYEEGERLPGGALWLSDVVAFVDEWRYYVAEGTVIVSGWYQGQNEDTIAPELDIDWPRDFSGTVDFGRLDTGEIALVEAHAPMACGWYGSNEDAGFYVAWQRLAWENRGFWLERS
jgi:hypothetical protein